MLISSKCLKNKKYALGGKANSLIKLTKMGLPVPDFFVLPAKYFFNFAKLGGISERIEILKSEKKYKEIKNLILSCEFNSKLKKEIEEEVARLGLTEMSVRSSANNEDGKEKSFAGQYETFLNVKKSNLFESIKKCWVSVLEDNVISYIGDKNFDIYSVNVIVQKMINPDYAGVAFSLSPVCRSKGYSLIECCKGVGELLVSGQTTPTKFFVNRNNLEVDMVIGHDKLPKNKVEELEKYLLIIEKKYGLAVDVEWCLKNNKLYILQARPITAFSTAVETIKKSISREKFIFELEIYYLGEYFGIKSLTNGYFFNPIFEFKSPNLTNIYYNQKAIEEYPPCFFRELKKNFKAFKEQYKKVCADCQYVERVISGGERFKLKTFVKALIEIQPFSSLGNLAGQNWDVDEKVKDILFEYRKNYDSIIYRGTDYLKEQLIKGVPNNLKKFVSVLKIEELLNLSSLDLKNIKKRLGGFVFYDGKIYLSSFEKFLEENKFEVFNENLGEGIKGDVAYGGIVKAPVKVVLSVEDFGKFNEGDILVTSMTTPKFTRIMGMASGIITDEGGVTCHASIVARELKKPCLVGCKNATQNLKDGDIVVLNANQGTVEKIES